MKQTAATIVHATDQLQAAHCKFIKTHIFVFLDTGQRSDMSYLCMFRHIQILQDSSGSYNTILEMLNPESFQIFCFKMLQQLLPGTGFGKYPIIQFKSKELTSEISLKHSAFPTFEKNLFRSKIIQQLIYVVKRSFSRQELSGRNIQKCNTTSRFSKMNSCQKVIFLII